MLLVLTDEGPRKAPLNAIKFRARVRDWACDVGAGHVFNYLMLPDGIRLSNSICRAGLDLPVTPDTVAVSLASEPIPCPRENCACGFDISIPKGRSVQDLEELYEKARELGSFEEYYRLPDLEEAQVARAYGKIVFLLRHMVHVDWFLGPRCNYDCSYCSPTIHDHHSPYPTLESLRFSLETLLEHVAKAPPGPQGELDFLFHGGEPTLIPDYLKFLELVRNRTPYPVTITTLTNFSRSVDYQLALNAVSDVVYSLHLPYYRPESFVKLREFVVRRRDLPARGKFKVKVMFLSGQGGVVEDLHQALSEEPDISFEVTPLHDKRTKTLFPYANEEMKYFSYTTFPRVGG